MPFAGGTLSSSACVVASTVGQVLGYKLQLDQEEFGHQSVFSMASDDPTSLRALCHITSVMEEKNLPLDYELNPNISEKATTVLLPPWWQLHISTLLACIYWCPVICTSYQAEAKIVQERRTLYSERSVGLLYCDEGPSQAAAL
ncbi:uncharacterized protein ACIB01_009015 [Guaruba guarouba]